MRAGKTSAGSGTLPRQRSMQLHMINVRRRLEPPSSDASFSTHRPGTNDQTDYHSTMGTKMPNATLATVCTTEPSALLFLSSPPKPLQSDQEGWAQLSVDIGRSGN